MPVPDLEAPWGSTTCSKCPNRVCYGHFLTPEVLQESSGIPMSNPPSQVLKTRFSELMGTEPSDNDVEKIAKETLLLPQEVRIWMNNLQSIQTNCRRGAEKAAATKRSKARQHWQVKCVCGEEYTDRTDEVQYWIGCDQCSSWFHYECAGINPSLVPETFLCNNCDNSVA